MKIIEEIFGFFSTYSYVCYVMRETLNPLYDMNVNEMIKVQILKNDEVIKTLECVESKLHITYHTAQCIAGGMWNGTDVFTISINWNPFNGF